MSIFSSEPPTQPNLAANNVNPVDGTTLVLNCTVKNDQVNTYQFYHDGQPMGLPQPNNILNIVVSTDSNQNGDYQCSALIGNISSTYNNTVKISGRFSVVV